MKKVAVCVAIAGGLLGSGAPVTRAVSAPTVTAIHPNELAATVTATVTVAGTGFLPGATLGFRNADFPSFPASTATVHTVTPTQITATITTSAPGGPQPNVEDVIVTNPDGGQGVRPRGFTVSASPVYAHADPYVLAQGSTVDLRVQCTRCGTAVSASAGAGVAATVLEGRAPFLIRVTVSPDAPLGEHPFTVAFSNLGSVRTDPPLTIVDESSAADLSIVSPGATFTAGAAGGQGVPVIVRNAGPAAIGGVRLSAPLPAGFSLHSSTGFPCSSSAPSLSCDLGTLAPGQEVAGVVRLNVSRSAATSYAVLAVGGAASVAESRYDNNAATVAFTVAGTTTTTTGAAGGPVIASFSPTSGPAGTVVTIAGTGFTGTTQVTLNGAPVTVNSVTSTAISVTTRPYNTTGRFAVTANYQTAVSAGTFTVTGAGTPLISSFTPASGPAGTVVTLRGSNFTGTTQVTLNGAPVAILGVAEHELRVRIQPFNTSGRFAVTAHWLTGTSAGTFTVTR